MLKGCERRMIKIENTESELFESAYFIIRQNAQLPKKKRREDMLREAERIVNDKTMPGRPTARSQRRLWLERAVIFASGAFISAMAALLLRFF